MAHIVSHNPASVHAPSSGYSMGLELSQHRRLLFVSGQVPENSDGVVPEGFEAQCEQAWRNIIEVLNSAGLGVEHLVKSNTFLTDKSQVVPNRAIRRKMLQDAARKRTCIHGDGCRDRGRQMVVGDRGDCCRVREQ
jgi:enamine deaminase RidA (YjgF/YER057c/UK114 family)